MVRLSRLLCDENQPDAAEEAALHAHNLFSEEDNQYKLCGSHRILGETYQFRGETKRAIDHFEAALGIASSSNWHDELFWGHLSLAQLFRNDGRLDDANGHIERAKSYMVNSPYYVGCAMETQASIWYHQSRLEEARSEALRATDVYEKLGAAGDIKECRKLLQYIEEELGTPPVASGQSDFDCELL